MDWLHVLGWAHVHSLVPGRGVELFTGLHVAVTLQQILNIQLTSQTNRASDWPGLSRRSQIRTGGCLPCCTPHCTCRTADSRAWNSTPPGWLLWPRSGGWWRDWWASPPWCPPSARCLCEWGGSRTGHSTPCAPEGLQLRGTRNIPVKSRDFFLLLNHTWKFFHSVS